MANLKKLLVVVNFTTNPEGQIEQLVVASKETYPDRIFFVENTHEIITHGHKYGVSDEIANRLSTLETSFETLTGYKASAAKAEITDDSVIGKYVLAHTSSLEAADSSVVVDSTADDNGTHYTVKVDTKAIVDGDTILSADGKLKSNLRFDFIHEEVDGVQHPFLVLKTADQEIDGATKKGTVVDKFDVNEFVVDGMLKEVSFDDKNNVLVFKWNADGADKVTEIPITDILKLEAVHSTTEKYITVQTNTNPHDTEGAKGACYDVAAVVSDTDLTSVSALTKDADTEAYKSGVDTNAELNVALGKVAEGLADAKTVATKFADADKKSADMANDLIARLAALKTELSDADAKLQEQIDTNAEGIDQNKKDIEIINGDKNTAGSILARLEEFRESLDSTMEVADFNNLVTVTTAITDGALDADNSKVELKVNTLTVTTDADPEYKIGNVNYKVKALGAKGQENTIANEDPSLVTTQDAWVFGQCIKAQAIKEIASDNNDYIHIVREDNQTKIQFEPWAEVHDMGELKDAITY